MTSRRTPVASEEPPGNEPPPGSIAETYREVMPLVDFDAAMTKGDDVALTIPLESIHEVLERGRDDARLQMNLLRNQTAVDWEERGLEIVYHLYSIPLRQAVTIKSWLPAEGAVVESVADLYPMADWAERECREMFGIEFIGHPDPRNLLLDEDINIHPLRKSHPLAPIEMEQGVDVEFFTKQYPPPEPAEEEDAADETAAAAAPERKRVEDMTEEEREEQNAYTQQAFRFDKELNLRPAEQTQPSGRGTMPPELGRVFLPLHDELSKRTSGELPSDYDASIPAKWGTPQQFDRHPAYDPSLLRYDEVDIYGNALD